MRTRQPPHRQILNRDDEPEGYEHGYLKVAPLIGGATMNGGYYVLPPGQANCPYHYESDEEWLLVLEGRVTVRHPEGEDVLEAGRPRVLPGRPRRRPQAHEQRRRDGAACSIVSTNNLPAVAVYPTAARSASGPRAAATTSWSAASGAVDYYDGEV